MPVCKGGVYLVALTPDARSSNLATAACPLSHAALEAWLHRRPELRLDRKRPTVDELAERLATFWLSDEIVLYIGQTTDTLAARIHAYYTTPLGARHPHAGGHWLKPLSNLDSLFVHYAYAGDPEAAEVLMLKRFCDTVTPTMRSALHDPNCPLPYANLEWPKGHVWPGGNRKRHGLRGTREPRLCIDPVMP